MAHLRVICLEKSFDSLPRLQMFWADKGFHSGISQIPSAVHSPRSPRSRTRHLQFRNPLSFFFYDLDPNLDPRLKSKTHISRHLTPHH